jgi:hypothetical protein
MTNLVPNRIANNVGSHKMLHIAAQIPAVARALSTFTNSRHASAATLTAAQVSGGVALTLNSVIVRLIEQKVVRSLR